MKNNLYIFGDSFSTNFSTDSSVKLEDSWPMLFKEKYNVKNFAKAGYCNGEIVKSIIINAEKIKKNDIVIIEIGFFDRIYDEFENQTFVFRDKRFKKYEIKYYREKYEFINNYIENYLLKFRFILDYLELKKVKCYYWFIDNIPDDIGNNFNLLGDTNKIIKYNNNVSMFNYFVENNPEFWVNDGDMHFNKLGHNQFFNLINEKINNNRG